MASKKLSSNVLKLNWNSIEINSKTFLFKFYSNDVLYEFLIFDFINFKLFYVIKKEKEILDLFKTLNPSLEAPISKIISHLSDNLLDSTQKNKSTYLTELENNHLCIKIQSKLAGVKFNWEFRLEQLDSSCLKDYLVLPLILNCAEYQLREIELLKIIQAKDKELDDYKSQGVKLTRKYLNTDSFNIDSFDNFIQNKEINEITEKPEKCLETEVSNKINQACYEKYLKKILAKTQASCDDENLVNDDLQNLIKNNEKNSNKHEGELCNSKPNKDSFAQKESRIEKLETKLKEDEQKKTAKNNKKKKLF